MYVNGDNVTYFNGFVVEYNDKENNNFIENKDIITNVHRIQVSYSLICGYFCTKFIEFMLKG